MNHVNFKKIITVLLFLSLASLFFQNCSSDFQALNDQSQEALESQTQSVKEFESNLDKKYLDQLITSKEILFDSTSLDSKNEKLFLQDFTFFIVIRNSQQNSVVNFIVDNEQKTSLIVENSIATLTHQAPEKSFSSIKYSTKTNNDPLVISGRIGKEAKNMVLMINGEFNNPNIEFVGTPINYYYLSTDIESKNVDRIIIFKSVLEPTQMNVFSRYLGNQYSIKTKTNLETPDFYEWDSSSNTQFSEVKQILSKNCFSCHDSWKNLQESDYIKATAFSGNKILVVKKDLSTSMLWYRLSGTSDSNSSARKTMPLKSDNTSGPSLSNIDLDIIKNWILNSEFKM